jgi:hypothetical protein
MSVEYKVPRLLWENLESVLLAQSKRYIGELAKRLHVSEKELLKRVLPTSDSLHITIQDTHQESNQCKAYVQQDNVTIFCKKAVAHQSEYCPFHRQKRMTVIEGTGPRAVQRIKDRSTMEPLWCAGNTLLNATGKITGTIHHDEQKMRIFILEEVPKT